jgi:hypothetical protein
MTEKIGFSIPAVHGLLFLPITVVTCRSEAKAIERPFKIYLTSEMLVD